MGEMQQLLPAAVSSNSQPTIPESKQSVSPAPSDNTVTAPLVSSNSNVKPQQGRRSAIFSTDLGRRAPRGLQHPRFCQPIARSDTVMDVVVGAGHLLRKYPYQYMDIFPQQDWQIGDLWDDHDIQIEGEGYFTEMLGFIERDNVVRVQKYACEYAQKYTGRLNLIGGDLTGLYDEASHLSIVDKIFVNGETRDYPPVFLWKVAHFLRTNMLAIQSMSVPPKDAAGAPGGPVTSHKDSVVHSTVQAPASVEATASAPAATTTATKASTPVVRPAPTMPHTQAISTWHQEQQFPRLPAGAPVNGRFAPSAGPVGGLGYTEPMGHMVPVLPAHHAVGPNMARSSMHYPRTRARSASGSHNQITPASPYVENMPRISSGFGPRQHAGPMLATQSPRFHQAHMAMSHQMSSVTPNMMPFVYDQDLMGPGTMAGQPHPTGAMHPGSMSHHAKPGPPMVHAYPRYTSNTQVPPFAMPMADMTNVHYGGHPGMPMQHVDPRHPNDRRLSQQHANGNALYDPYEGNNVAFRSAGCPNGKKFNQNGMHNSNGRQRKPSFPGSRPYHGQYTNGRPQTGGHYVPGPKPYLEDDLTVTQDREYGCHIDWIGPQNTTVNELYVKDLPEDIREAELQALFQERLGTRPTSINLRVSPQLPQQIQARKHAFVGFSSCTTAKQALHIHNPTIRGLTISITVPKRFFKKTLDVPQRDVVEAGPSAYSRYTSNPNNREGRNRVSSVHESNDVTDSTAVTKEKLSYSPQDARSDLPKKKKGKQTQQSQATAGSPETRKAKPRKQSQELPTEEKPTPPTKAVKTDDLDVSAKADEPVLESITIDETIPTVSAQTEKPQASDMTPPVAIEDAAKSADTEAIVLNPGAGDKAAKATPKKFLLEQASPEAQQMVDPRTEIMVEEDLVKSQVDAKDTVAQPVLSIPLESEVSPSDDELKNEASFHSAAESQSDLEAKVNSKVGSDVTNHGSTTPAPTTDIATKNVDIPSGDALIFTAAENELPETAPKVLATPSAELQAIAVPAATQEDTNAPTTLTVISEQTKKSGPQQTEALFPLSKKQLATQAKREKEQKKKAQRKEKELTQKAKAEKVAASKSVAKKVPAANVTTVNVHGTVDKTDVDIEAKLAVDVKSASMSAATPPTTRDVLNTNASTKKLKSATSQKTADSNRDKPEKRKGKTSAPKVTASAEDKSEDHGKQTNGTSISHETGSVTKKDVKVESQGSTQETAVKENTQENAPAPDAQSSEQDDSRDVASGMPGSNTAVAFGDSSTPSGKKKNRKTRKNPAVTEGAEETTKPGLTWPNLEFRPKSPNPPWMGPIDMENDVQKYEKIMDEACGGPDDSEYSWSDLPTMEDVLSSDEGEAPAAQAGGSRHHLSMDVNEVQKRKTYASALFPKIKKLQPDTATEILARVVNVATIEEMAKLVTDNAALVEKVDEIVLFDLSQNTADSKDSQPVATQSSTVSREEIVNRGLAAIEVQIAAKKEELEAADVNCAAYDKQLSEHKGTQETSSADEGRVAVLEAQLTATRAETAAAEANVAALEQQRAERTDGQDSSYAVTPDSQPAKKKKANKHKKKKKKKPAENGEASNPGDPVDTTVGTASTPSKAAAGPIDPKGPWAHQFGEVDAIINLGQNEAADSKASVQIRGGAATPTDESDLIRTMEAYFREAHPERRSKGRKAVQGDLK